MATLSQIGSQASPCPGDSACLSTPASSASAALIAHTNIHAQLVSSLTHCPSAGPPSLPTQNKLPTPINIDRLRYWLQGYDSDLADQLITGFTEGFIIPTSAEPHALPVFNHPSIRQFKDIVKDKLNTELQAGRLAGPFDTPPFDPFYVSPISLIPKRTEGEYRLIQNLSYPYYNELSINAGIDRSLSRWW